MTGYECQVCGTTRPGYHADWCEGAPETLIARIAELRKETADVKYHYSNNYQHQATATKERLDELSDKLDDCLHALKQLAEKEAE